MRRPIWFRVLISLWAVWFATALTGRAESFGCPMHSSVAANHASAPHVTSMPQSSTAEQGNAPLQHHHAVTNTSGDQPQHSDAPTHSCCTCLGQCCTMAAAEMPRDAYVLPLEAAPRLAAVAYEHTARLPQRPAHALPFANGPPLTTRL